jgi:hypothetical protein
MGHSSGEDGKHDFRIVVALPEHDGDVVHEPVIARES